MYRLVVIDDEIIVAVGIKAANTRLKLSTKFDTRRWFMR